MITSSLPPELKVMIASGFLLGGGLLALRFPADREEEPVAATVVAQHSETPASPMTSQEPTSMAHGIDEESRFEPIWDFVNSTENSEWQRMALSESDATMSTTGASEFEETPTLDRESYDGMSVDRSDAASQEIVQVPEYIPFRTTPVIMPEPNSAFSAVRQSPPNLTGLPLSVEPNAIVPSTIPSTVVAPSAVMQAGVPANRITPIATSDPISATLGRPVIPAPTVESDTRTANDITPVVPPGKLSRSGVIVAPARTIFVPNL